MASPFKKEYEYFLYLYEIQSITEASYALGLQQAALSKSLLSLEKSLGAKLFYRHTRGITPTEFGDTLYKGLLATKELWAESFASGKKKLDEISGNYLLGVHPAVATTHLAQVYPRILENSPLLNLNLVLKKSDEVTKDVVDFKLDLGLVANPDPHPDLVIKKVASDLIYVWKRSLKSHSNVLYYNSEMVGIAKTLKQFKNCKQVRIDNYNLLLSLMKSSSGHCILPEAIAKKGPYLVKHGPATTKVQISLIYRQDRLKSKAFLHILENIKSALA